MSLTADVLAHAHSLGFDRAGILPIGPPARYAAFVAWLAAGYGGEMAYLAARAAERADPALVAAGARSMIVLVASYNVPAPPAPRLRGELASPQDWGGRGAACIARYARSADYHDVLKHRLYELDAFIRQRTGRTTLGKVCVDTAPLLERDFASQAGLGFIGRNTCLITPGLGSWTTLAALLVLEELDEGGCVSLSGHASIPSAGSGQALSEVRRCAPDAVEGCDRHDRSASFDCGLRPSAQDAPLLLASNVKDTREERTTSDEDAFVVRPSSFVFGRSSFVGCGRCTRCLDACPTRAFVAPYVLDARRCIAYLTIELRGPIPRDLRSLMGHWVFGCDVCQEVCPYNRTASRSLRGAAAPKQSLTSPEIASAQNPRLAMTDDTLSLSNLLSLDDAAFRARFRGTPLMRAKRRGLVRNACVAAGNSGDPTLAPALIALLADAEPLVRGHAAWALGRLGGAAAMTALAHALAAEGDAWVREEIACARSPLPKNT